MAEKLWPQDFQLFNPVAERRIRYSKTTEAPSRKIEIRNSWPSRPIVANLARASACAVDQWAAFPNQAGSQRPETELNLK